MLNRDWGAESNGKLPHLSIPSKTAAWIPEFAVEDLPLSRIAFLVPEFAVNDLPLGKIQNNLMMIMSIMITLNVYSTTYVPVVRHKELENKIP